MAKSFWVWFWSNVFRPNPLKRPNKYSTHIAFTRKDGQQYAMRLREFLIASGIDVYSDQDSSSLSQGFIDSVTLLDGIDVFIYVGTPMAYESKYLQEELKYYYNENTTSKGKRIIPIYFGDSYHDSRQRIDPILYKLVSLSEDLAALESGPSPKIISEILKVYSDLGHKITNNRLTFNSSAELENPIKTIEHKVNEIDAVVKEIIPKRALNEGKLILVGRGEVGKTSLIKRLVHNEFEGDESKTQGINITTWPLECESATFRLNIWDFGGQEIMHATHQFFLTEQSLYLLVLNGREGGEDADAEYWLKHIETFGGSSPVIIVLNKISQHPFDLNYRGLQNRYPQIRAFVKTDCKDGLGLEQLKQVIRQSVDAMPEMKLEFPSDWFAVKQRLEQMQHEFISYETFRGLCVENGISENSEQEKLRYVLHCLGIILNFRNDSRLRDTSVLKPEWVTNGIYSIINARALAEQQGVLQLEQLSQFLPADRYPPDKYPFLFELMRKFSLCFSFPEDQDRYLIPELLGKEEPAVTTSFRAEECLNFEYHYGVLPEGLLPRFIVRSHVLSRNQQRWRFGVILAHEDCIAVVYVTPVDRRIIIRLKGGNAASRRRLLAIIRYDFDRINAEFKDKLDVQPKVPLVTHPAFAIDYNKLLAFEKQGEFSFKEFIDQQVVTVDVNELLNGIDLEQQRGWTLDKLRQARSLFFSYSHRDEVLRDELETHLKLLQRQGILSVWHDRKIPAGSDWDQAIDQHMERADIILFLISSDFIASDYCWNNEVKRAMERYKRGEAMAIPIILRSCDWKSAPFSKLQGFPKDMKPITAWPDRDEAWTSVATGIRKLVEAQRM